MTILIVFIWFFMENHKIIDKVYDSVLYILTKKGAFYGVYY